MSPKTTVVILCFAGDKGTSQLLEPVLAQVQLGLCQLGDLAHDVRVLCYYRRFDAETGYYFEIRPNVPTFSGDDCVMLIQENLSEICGAQPIGGDILAQLRTFCDLVNTRLPTEGPVHIVIGAHGIAAEGISSTGLFLLFTSLFRNTDPTLKTLSVWSRIVSLWTRIRRIGHPPGALLAGSISEVIGLDNLNGAIARISRVSSVFFHTCNLSTIESICALPVAKFHIAFQHDLLGRVPFAKWFGTLADSSSRFERIAADALNSIGSDSCPTTHGWTSAHVTDMSLQLLQALDELGRHLTDFLNCDEQRATCSIKNARVPLLNYFTDAILFSKNLAADDNVSRPCQAAASCFAAEVERLQIQTRPAGVSDKRTGISLYLPAKGNSGINTSCLPTSMQTTSPCWIEFLERWTS